jgi:hypothetical protein
LHSVPLLESGLVVQGLTNPFINIP